MEKVIIRNLNEAFVHVTCSQAISYELRDHFTFQVPGYQFTPAYRNRVWDGKIRLFKPNNQIYRGLVPALVKLCQEREYEWIYDNEDFDDEFSLNEAKAFVESLKLPVELYDFQLESFVAAIRSRRLLILSPTSSGKSMVLYLIVRYLLQNDTKPGLIIVPTISLVEQLFSDFKDYSKLNGWDVEKFVQKIYQGAEKDTVKAVSISTWQSIYKLPKKYFHNFNFVLGDECHLFQAKSLTSIMENLVNARYRIGLTGTLTGAKTHELVLNGLFGSIRQATTTKEMIDRKIAADLTIKCIALKHPEVMCKASKQFTYQDEMKYLVLSEARNKFIKNLALSLEGNTLILFQYVDKHGKILYDMLSKEISPERNLYFIAGETDVEIRESVRKEIETQENAIVVASFGTFSTGINIRNLHNIIFASPYKARVKTLQSIGRGLRISDTKKTATLFDIGDDLRYKKHVNFTFKHMGERLKLYSSEKFRWKIYQVNLKQ